MFTRVRTALVVGLLLFLPFIAAKTKAADSHDADTAAIKKLFADFNNAFNNHDAHAAAECFTSDADFINIAGATTKGSAEIEQHMAPLFAGRLKTGHREVTFRDIHFLTPDVATIDSDYVMSGVAGANGAEVPPAKGIYDWVVVKKGGQWKIAVWHESNLPAPAGPGR